MFETAGVSVSLQAPPAGVESLWTIDDENVAELLGGASPLFSYVNAVGFCDGALRQLMTQLLKYRGVGTASGSAPCGSGLADREAARSGGSWPALDIFEAVCLKAAAYRVAFTRESEAVREAVGRVSDYQRDQVLPLYRKCLGESMVKSIYFHQAQQLEKLLGRYRDELALPKMSSRCDELLTSLGIALTAGNKKRIRPMPKIFCSLIDADLKARRSGGSVKRGAVLPSSTLLVVAAMSAPDPNYNSHGVDIHSKVFSQSIAWHEDTSIDISGVEDVELRKCLQTEQHRLTIARKISQMSNAVEAALFNCDTQIQRILDFDRFTAEFAQRNSLLLYDALHREALQMAGRHACASGGDFEKQVAQVGQHRIVSVAFARYAEWLQPIFGGIAEFLAWFDRCSECTLAPDEEQEALAHLARMGESIDSMDSAARKWHLFRAYCKMLFRPCLVLLRNVIYYREITSAATGHASRRVIGELDAVLCDATTNRVLLVVEMKKSPLDVVFATRQFVNLLSSLSFDASRQTPAGVSTVPTAAVASAEQSALFFAVAAKEPAAAEEPNGHEESEETETSPDEDAQKIAADLTESLHGFAAAQWVRACPAAPGAVRVLPLDYAAFCTVTASPVEMFLVVTAKTGNSLFPIPSKRGLQTLFVESLAQQFVSYVLQDGDLPSDTSNVANFKVSMHALMQKYLQGPNSSCRVSQRGAGAVLAMLKKRAAKELCNVPSPRDFWRTLKWHHTTDNLILL